MNNNNLGGLNSELRIGSNCWYMNISGIFEYHKLLYQALAYTIYDFIYSPEFFINFINPKSPEEYISPLDDLVIMGSIDSVYNNDVSKYIKMLQSNFNLFEVKKYQYSKDVLTIKKEYLSRNIPLIFPCDHYYLFENYKQQIKNMRHYHTSQHKATLIDMDIDSGKCIIIDKFFSYMGQVDLEGFVQACNSPYIKEQDKTFMHYIEMKDRSCGDNIQAIRELLKQNIDMNLCESITIESRCYDKGLRAVESFLMNIKDILAIMVSLKGKYAPQFTTYLLQQTRLLKKSYNHLIKSLNSQLNIRELEEISSILDNTVNRWSLLDSLCDKCYLSRKTLTDYTDDFISIFKQIYEEEKQVFHKLSIVRNLL